MPKIVYNACYGGFSLSDEGLALFRALGGVAEDDLDFPEDRRHDPILVEVVETIGDKASGNCAKLKMVEVSSGTPYRIENHDGFETVKTLNIREWTVAL